LTREEFKKAKVIEEARKAGTLPAEIDEEGREINPHIPQYIAQAPWYLSSSAPSLKHQRKYQEEKEASKDWYARGEKKVIKIQQFKI
jgi:pre-mRNA-processing factor SLU7